jgi:hypothetical protein
LIKNFEHRFSGLLIAAAGVFTCCSALANDTSIGVDNGTIVFKHQADISMDKEVLFISEKNVQVDYVFTNGSQSDLRVLVAFPMSPRVYEVGVHGVIKNFKVWIDGVPGKTKRQMRVMLDGKTDVTAEAARLGWSERDLMKLLQGSEMMKRKKPLPAAWFKEGYGPLFTLNEYFVWQQTFPAGRSVSIRHSYVPSVTTGVPIDTDTLVREYGQRTCMDADAKAGASSRAGKYGVNWSHLSYVLLTANNWQGPIKDFTLKIRKSSADDLISTCFEGELKTVDPLTFEYHQKNYRPQSDLSVLFLKR